jgi:anti-sigma regulatory factor (Ser/Thr protein kinase)
LTLPGKGRLVPFGHGFRIRRPPAGDPPREASVQAPRDWELLTNAALLGTSLDVDETARRLADSAVPTLGEIAFVSLTGALSEGWDPPERTGSGELTLLRTAFSSRGTYRPAGGVPAGRALPPFRDGAVARRFRSGQGFAVSGRSRIVAGYVGDPATVGAVVPVTGEDEELSVAYVPLVTEERREAPGRPGLVLGSLEVWRARPFTDEDLRSLQWLADRGAVCVDNARRYTRERRLALTLQKSVLMRERSDEAAGETAGIHLAAGARDDLGGDWFAVIALSSARMALVVGDVVGYGMQAAATMGQMCTAVRTLADLDLAPDELLTHLDDLVVQLSDAEDPIHRGLLGSTCLYAVVDPITRRCAVASAGHPPPARVRPDGTTQFIDLVPGPVLGVGGLTFEVSEVDLEDGDVLALYSDGLLKDGRDDLARGMEDFRKRLAAAYPFGDDLFAEASGLVEGFREESLLDDVTLLLSRVRSVPVDDTACWDIPADPQLVADQRDKAIRQVEAWDLGELAFATELVVSELVTNAIRYGGGPATLRLIRDRDRLICEVSDPSQTAPHLRRAKDTEEGGRGLFITARLVTRWGVRYAPGGKTIWTEQRLHPQRPRYQAA